MSAKVIPRSSSSLYPTISHNAVIDPDPTAVEIDDGDADGSVLEGQLKRFGGLQVMLGVRRLIEHTHLEQLTIKPIDEIPADGSHVRG